jgi:hypothetical protein
LSGRWKNLPTHYALDIRRAEFSKSNRFLADRQAMAAMPKIVFNITNDDRPASYPHSLSFSRKAFSALLMLKSKKLLALPNY